MFTGIIKALGVVAELKKHGRHAVLTIRVSSPTALQVEPGASVSVDGVCLTVVARRGRILTFQLLESTLKRTRLGELRPRDQVNIEPALRAGERLGGHFVSGHVDGIGRVVEISRRWQTRYLTIAIPSRLVDYFIPQGSVVVNGVSLTVCEVHKIRRAKRRQVGKGDSFSVALTSYTVSRTNLGKLQAGELVNLEVDILAKYIIKLFSRYAVRYYRRKV